MGGRKYQRQVVAGVCGGENSLGAQTGEGAKKEGRPEPGGDQSQGEPVIPVGQGRREGGKESERGVEREDSQQERGFTIPSDGREKRQVGRCEREGVDKAKRTVFESMCLLPGAKDSFIKIQINFIHSN